MNVEEFNRNQALKNFPPENQWQAVEGILFQLRSDAQNQTLVSIGGRDHTGKEVHFWTDLQNAMYLMNLLAGVQKQLNCPVPNKPPMICQNFDGRV